MQGALRIIVAVVVVHRPDSFADARSPAAPLEVHMDSCRHLLTTLDTLMHHALPAVQPRAAHVALEIRFEARGDEHVVRAWMAGTVFEDEAESRRNFFALPSSPRCSVVRSVSDVCQFPIAYLREADLDYPAFPLLYQLLVIVSIVVASWVYCL